MHTQRWRKYFSREQFFDMWCLLCKNSFVQLLFCAVQMIFFFKYKFLVSVFVQHLWKHLCLCCGHTHMPMSAPHTPSPPTPPVVLWRLAISVQLEQCGRSIFFQERGLVRLCPKSVVYPWRSHFCARLPRLFSSCPFDHFSTVLPPLLCARMHVLRLYISAYYGIV